MSPCSAVGSKDALGSSNNKSPIVVSALIVRINVRDLGIRWLQLFWTIRENIERHTQQAFAFDHHSAMSNLRVACLPSLECDCNPLVAQRDSWFPQVYPSNDQ